MEATHMDPTIASLLGAIVGAMAGFVGGAFAALASIRASQIASRAPIANTLFRLAKAQVELGATILDTDLSPERRDRASRNVQTIWNELATQQAILCPSKRIGALLALMRETSRNMSQDPRHMLQLSGHIQARIALMISGYSQSLFRVCARHQEKKIIRDWLASKDSEVLTEEERKKIETLL